MKKYNTGMKRIFINLLDILTVIAMLLLPTWISIILAIIILNYNQNDKNR